MDTDAKATAEIRRCAELARAVQAAFAEEEAKVEARAGGAGV